MLTLQHHEDQYSPTLWMLLQLRRLAGRLICDKDLEGKGLHLGMAGMPEVVPLVLVPEAAGEDLYQRCAWPHEEGVHQASPMHPNLQQLSLMPLTCRKLMKMA